MLGSASPPLTDEQLRASPVAAKPFTVAAADILCGVATASGATIITIPADRTWLGHVTLSAAVRVAPGGAAVDASARVSTAGVGVTPAAGDYLRLDLSASASAAVTNNGTKDSGSVSARMIVIAPPDNPVTLVLNSTNTTVQSASVNGYLL